MLFLLFRLVGCNIVLMKHFLPLLMLTGLLFGQDVLILKSGESFEGAFYGKVGEDIVFKIEGETSTKKFPIWSVETIVTKNGELTYPFDIPTKKDNPSFGQDGFRVEFIESKDSSKRFIICAGACVGIIWLTYYIFFEHSMM